MFTDLCVISNHCWVTRRTSSTVWWNLENYYNNTDEKKLINPGYFTSIIFSTVRKIKKFYEAPR